jgi:hypothetical protein
MIQGTLRRTAIGFTLFGLIVVAALSSVPAYAQSPGPAQGIEISPALVDLNAERGKTYTIKIKVTNVTPASLVYTSEVNDFTAGKDETGSPQVLIGSSLPPAASIIKWVSAVQDFTLESRESRILYATITVPADAEPGGHYGALRFSGHAPELTETGVGLSASAGMLMLIRVSGDIKESASLTSFYTAFPSDKTKQASLFEGSYIGFVTRIKDDGNVHVKPIGNIEITDAFGNLVGTVAVNDSKSNVLPGSIRRFESEYKGNLMFGLYTANLTLGYGTTGQAITNTITFWVIPWKLILIGIIVLITLIFIASRLIKVYNRHIIAKARNEHTTKNKKTAKKKL